MIRVKHRGDLNKTLKFLKHISKHSYMHILQKYGEEGARALAEATPKDSGLTAASWGYEITQSKNGLKITWTNSHMGDGWFPVALMLQYGHGTGTGGWIEGRDYINPAVRPIFDKMADAVWREVTNA
jgi:hypothetical protein